MMANESIERLKEILRIAYELKWITPTQKGKSYPEMQLSEVEKCMLAMVDDFEFKRLKKWKEAAQVSVAVV